MFKKLFIVLGMAIMLGACTNGGNMDHYTGKTPEMDFKEYFTGPIQAWGIVQDYRGRIVRQFDIDLVGRWDGNEGTLAEDFRYYDGERQQREWKITRLAENRYEGRADDVIGPAKGKSNGNAINWNYTITLPVGDKTYDVKFNDWMFLMNDGVLINRTYIRKFGIKVAELTIFMKKQPSDPAE